MWIGSDYFGLSSGSHFGWAFFHFSAGSRIQRIFKVWIFYCTFKFPWTDTNATAYRYWNTQLHYDLVKLCLYFVFFFSSISIVYSRIVTWLITIFVPNLSPTGILYLIQRETHSRLLASLFKILMLLLSSTPYGSSPLSDLIIFWLISLFSTRCTVSLFATASHVGLLVLN